MRNIGIFIPFTSSKDNITDDNNIFSNVVFIAYSNCFDLWQKAFNFYIDRDSTWEFLVEHRSIDLSYLRGEIVGGQSMMNAAEFTIPLIYGNTELYEAYTSTFFNRKLMSGDVLYLKRLDVVGIINEVRFELSKLMKYDVYKYDSVLNAIAMGRVSSLQDLMK